MLHIAHLDIHTRIPNINNCSMDYVAVSGFFFFTFFSSTFIFINWFIGLFFLCLLMRVLLFVNFQLSLYILQSTFLFLFVISINVTIPDIFIPTSSPLISLDSVYIFSDLYAFHFLYILFNTPDFIFCIYNHSTVIFQVLYK